MKRKWTAAEKRHQQKVRELGCIVCRLEGKGLTPPQIHHPKLNGKTDNMMILPLCYYHHMADQQQPPNPAYTSRHPNRKAFEERHGSEDYLLEQVTILLNK